MIQRATVRDVPTLLPLVMAYWQFESIAGFESGRIETQLNRLLTEPRLGAGWIATRDGAAVGYLIAVYVFSLEHLGVTAEIDEFFLLPQWRAHGIGAQLLTAAESEFEQVGCTRVSLRLARDNAQARSFYHRHAYSEIPRFEILEKALHDT